MFNCRKLILIIVAFVFILSCGSSKSNYVPSEITVPFPATDASISLDFDFSATGSGSGLIGDINISGSEGTIVINDQTLDTIIYASIPWEEAGRHLYQGIAFLDSDLVIYWLYCNSSNSLYTIFYESTDRYAMTQEAASGTCYFQDKSSQPVLLVEGRDVGISRLVSGHTITGDDISLGSGEAGELIYNGTPFVFYPFEEVDCSGCTGGPWWELHSIAYDSAGQAACFTILYLYNDSDNIYSGYSLCLPELNNINATFYGTWTSADISFSIK